MHETEESNSSAPLMRRGDLIHNVVEGTVEQYKVLDFLGKGGFGECFAAESALMRNYVAIKVVSKLRLKDRQTQKIFREIDIHRLAHHPNIVRMFDAFQDRSNFYMVMELCKASSLLTLINDEHMKKGHFDEWQGSRYVNQLCDAVIYLAKRNIIHRDLKPGNVLIAHNGDIKLGDFGLASKMEHLTRGSVSGTPNYLAPEVICKEGHSLASEVWSIGCLIFCMLVGKPPFESDSIESTYDRIRKGYYSYPDRPDVSFNAKELIRECLHPNPESRVGIYWIIDYIWLQNTRGGGYPLMRAKSTGNIIPKDINGNQCQLPRYLRPKSAMMNSSVPDRSRRKSFTASHDSGFGSESDMFRTSNAAFHNLIEKVSQYVESMKNVRANSLMLSPSTMPPVAIAKWVDYSNRRGFGCKLTDGTLTVKFNEGACLSWPSNSEFLLYTSQPFASPKFLSLSGSLSPTEKEHLETAKEYGEYMDRELQGLDILTDSSPKSLSDSIYIVYHHLDAHHLLVMFNNGLIQMTLMECKTKLIFWKEDTDRHIGVAILTRDNAPSAYRIVPLDCREIFRSDDSMVPIRPPTRIYETFGEAITHIEQDLFRLSTPRAVQVTSC